jgi:16S rRNA (cytosine967-C5)-methyltransferase
VLTAGVPPVVVVAPRRPMERVSQRLLGTGRATPLPLQVACDGGQLASIRQIAETIHWPLITAFMPVSPARAAAFDILLRMEQTDAFASELLHSTRFAQLSPEDHRLTTEIVMGTLRWRATLDRYLAGVSSQAKLDAEVQAALRIGAYQILFLDRIPARAAVNESVELVKRARKRSAAPFVNAVLRKLRPAPRLELTDRSPQAIAAFYSHPEWMVERWVRFFGSEQAEFICRHDQQAPGAAIRLRAPSAETKLARDGIKLEPGVLLTSARRVMAGDITHSAVFLRGEVAIQDEASQLVALLVGCGRRILDCCAAPGGKTALIADRNPQAAILAAELHPHRAFLMRRLVPNANVHVVTADIRSLAVSGQFDRVLVDAPCSGTGTLARHPEIKWRLQREQVSTLQRLQVEILTAAMKHLASGGHLLYSTCSLEREENEDVIENALARESGFELLDCRLELERLRQAGDLNWSDLDSLLSGRFLRTLPGVHPTDGFFAALLKKN